MNSHNASFQLFFPAMAGLFLVLAIVGFFPNSVAVLNGTMPPPPFYVHIHAVVMFGWVSVFFAQTLLVASERVDLHRTIGLYSILLAVAVLATMLQMAVTNFPAGVFGPFVIALQTRRILLFGGFVLVAMLLRRSNTGAHKRLLLLATLVPLDAAFNRMGWLPDFGIERAAVLIKVYEVILLLPLWVYDVRTLGRPHIATILGTACLALFGAALVFLAWDFPKGN